MDADADLLAAWLTATLHGNPDDITVIEHAARFDLPLAASVLLGAPPRRDDQYDEDKHPRDAIGRFITSNGEVKIGNVQVPGAGGKKIDLSNRRGRVVSVTPNPDTPGRPDVKVAILGPDGKTETTVTLKPKDMSAIREKARLDRTIGDKPAGQRLSRDEREDRQAERYEERHRRVPDEAKLTLARKLGWDAKKETYTEWREDRTRMKESAAKQRGWNPLKEDLNHFIQGEQEAWARERGWNPKSQSLREWREARAHAEGWDPAKMDFRQWRVQQRLKDLRGPTTSPGLQHAVEQGWNPKNETLAEYRKRRRQRAAKRYDTPDIGPEPSRRRPGETWNEFKKRRDDAETARRASGVPVTGTRPGPVTDTATPQYTERALLALGDWDPDLHPRGRDGRWIEILGLVRLFDFDFTGEDGRTVDLNGRRGQVSAIHPDPDDPGNPDIEVSLLDSDGNPGPKVTVKPAHILDAPEKARLRPAAVEGEDSHPGQEFGPNTPEWNLAPTLKVGRDEEGRRVPIPKTDADMANYPTPPGQAPDLADEALRAELDAEAAELFNITIDEDLAEGATGEWEAAIMREKARRDAARPSMGYRAEYIAKINEDAARLDTVDAEHRAHQLDEMLSPRRNSPVDTNQIYDAGFPPEQGNDYTSGGYTADRNWNPDIDIDLEQARNDRVFQHEEMYQEILAAIKEANIPQERDALALGGLPGAGKTFSLRPGQKADRFNVVAWETNQPIAEWRAARIAQGLDPNATHVSINPDVIKEMLMDRGMLTPGIDTTLLKPMEQATFVHEESSYLSKLFVRRLSKEGYNIVLDNTMDKANGMARRMAPLARQGYMFRGLFVDIPVQESRTSAMKRYIDSAFTERGGRFVPSAVLGNAASRKGNMSKNRDAFDTLVEDDWFTDYMAINNTGVSERKPKGEVTADGTGDGSAATKIAEQAQRDLAKRQGPPTPKRVPTVIPDKQWGKFKPSKSGPSMPVPVFPPELPGVESPV